MNRVTDVIWKDQRLKEGMALFESFTRNLTDVSSFCIFAQNNKKKKEHYSRLLLNRITRIIRERT